MNRILGLDGIRALACLLVIAHHTIPRLPQSETLMSELLQTAGHYAQVGVSVFFVLSGMLLSMPFWRAIDEGRQRPSFRTFIWRRMARIAPGFYLALIVSQLFAIAYFGTQVNEQMFIRFISAFLFLNSFHPVTLFPTDINGALWSIGFEVLSYGLLLLCLVLLFRHRASEKYRSAVCFVGIAFLASILLHLAWCRVVGMPTAGLGWDYGIIGFARTWMPFTNPFALFNHFAIGILAGAALVYARKTYTGSIRFDIALLGLSAFVVAAIGGLYFVLDTPFGGVFNSLYFWPFFPLLVGLWLVLLPFTQMLYRPFEVAPLRFLAKISFGVYIWHMIVIEAVALWIFPEFVFDGGMSLSDWLLAMAMTLSGAVGLASASWYWLEQPVLNWASNKRARNIGNQPASTLNV